jgi:hypothetical protein
MPRLFSDPTEPPKQKAEAMLPRTLAERKAARREMIKLNARILEGFRNRARYRQPRRETPEPWREFIREK